MKIMPFAISLPPISQVPGIVTMESAKAFDDRGGGPLKEYIT